MYNCHSILECCVMFSGVKLSIRSFVLFTMFELGFFQLKNAWLGTGCPFPVTCLFQVS